MKALTYITESNGVAVELVPNFNAVAVLTKNNGIKKYQDSIWELQPLKAFMFEDEYTCQQFIANFGKIKNRYNEILPEGTVYYTVNLTNLKAVNYADRLIS